MFFVSNLFFLASINLFVSHYGKLHVSTFYAKKTSIQL